MHRTAWLAALAVMLAPGPSFGQARSGPVGRAGRDGPPPAVAFREVGAFGAQPDEEGTIKRTVRLEMEGGQKLEGTISFQPLIVESDLGQYTIRPDKIKTIQFLRRANVDDAAAAEEPRNPRPNVMMAGPGMMRPMRTGTLVRGKVVTTSDQVIIGDIHIPPNFALELEFGRLTPAPDKLRVLTMIDGAAPPAPEAKPGAAPDAAAPKAAPGRPGASRKGA